jgi:hypothetical protein
MNFFIDSPKGGRRTVGLATPPFFIDPSCMNEICKYLIPPA